MGWGERLKSERARLGKTQEDVARLGGVTVQSQRMYESNKRPPNTKYLDLVSKAGFDTQYIVTGQRSVNHEVIYDEPTDALGVVLELQKDYGTFSAEQLKSLIGFAWQYQVSSDGLREFIETAYALSGAKKPNKEN